MSFKRLKYYSLSLLLTNLCIFYFSFIQEINFKISYIYLICLIINILVISNFLTKKSLFTDDLLKFIIAFFSNFGLLQLSFQIKNGINIRIIFSILLIIAAILIYLFKLLNLKDEEKSIKNSGLVLYFYLLGPIIYYTNYLILVSNVHQVDTSIYWTIMLWILMFIREKKYKLNDLFIVVLLSVGILATTFIIFSINNNLIIMVSYFALLILSLISFKFLKNVKVISA